VRRDNHPAALAAKEKRLAGAAKTSFTKQCVTDGVRAAVKR
jgi:hypothetical protein